MGRKELKSIKVNWPNLNLYVVVSRVTSKDDMKILLTDDNGDCIDTTSNVVYFIFLNLQILLGQVSTRCTIPAKEEKEYKTAREGQSNIDTQHQISSLKNLLLPDSKQNRKTNTNNAQKQHLQTGQPLKQITKRTKNKPPEKAPSAQTTKPKTDSQTCTRHATPATPKHNRNLLKTTLGSLQTCNHN